VERWKTIPGVDQLLAWSLRAEIGTDMLSGAPYGYRYMRKSDTSAAFYEVIESEAKVVRLVFEIYTQQGLASIPSRDC